MAELDDIRDRLEVIADELAALALDRLKTAVRQGETKAPAGEKRLTRARRAVEKAIALIDADENASANERDDDQDLGE